MSTEAPNTGRIAGTGKPSTTPSVADSPSRITVVETVYFHNRGIDPAVITSKFGRPLETDEQAFVRRATMTEDWVPLDVGWVKKAAMIVIQNLEGRNLQVNPTPEEKLETASRVVELSFGCGVEKDEGPRDMFSAPKSKPTPIPHILLLPGESLRLQPFTLLGIMIRSRSGSAKVVINVIPG